MDIKDIGHFKQLLQVGNTYRISKFSCLQNISNVGFPEHYFNFAASLMKLNQQPMLKIQFSQIILQGVTGLVVTGDATRRRKKKRTIYIQNQNKVFVSVIAATVIVIFQVIIIECLGLWVPSQIHHRLHH